MHAALLLLVAAAGWAFGQKDSDPGKLTPIDWKQRKAPVTQGGEGAKGETSTSKAGQEPGWVCSKDVYPVQVADPEANMKTGNPVMGVRRCWKEGDPTHWVEKPFNMMDPTQEAIQAATGGIPLMTGGRKSRFMPMIKPKPKPKKKPAKPSAAGVSVSSAAAVQR